VELAAQHEILDVDGKWAAQSLLNTDSQDILATPVPGFLCPSCNGTVLNNAGGEYRPRALGGSPRINVAKSNYAGVCDHNSRNIDNRQNNCQGVLYVDSPTRFGDVTDGTSTVLMVGERSRERQHARCNRKQNCGAALMYVIASSNRYSHDNRGNAAAVGTVRDGLNWDSTVADCTNLWNAKSNFHSLHPGGVQFVLVDGSTHFISDDVDITTIRRLGDRRDGNSVQVP